MAALAVGEGALGPARGQRGGGLGLQRHPHRLAVAVERDRQQRGQLVRPLRHEIVDEAVDQRSRHARRRRRHHVEPVRGQPRAEHRRGHDPQPPPHRPREPAQHPLVGQRLRPHRVEDAARRRLRVREPRQPLDQVGESDRLAARAHPARRDHDRQVVDEVADHLERRRAGADDDASPQLGDGRAARSQPLARLAPRAQVRRRGARGRLEPAEVDHAAHARAVGGLAERVRRPPVDGGEAPPRRHRVDEVVGDLGAVQRAAERGAVEGVGGRDLDAVPAARLEGVEAPRGGAHGVAAGGQRRHEVRADVPARAQHQHPRHARRPGQGADARATNGQTRFSSLSPPPPPVRVPPDAGVR